MESGFVLKLNYEVPLKAFKRMHNFIDFNIAPPKKIVMIKKKSSEAQKVRLSEKEVPSNKVNKLPDEENMIPEQNERKEKEVTNETSQKRKDAEVIITIDKKGNSANDETNTRKKRRKDLSQSVILTDSEYEGQSNESDVDDGIQEIPPNRKNVYETRSRHASSKK